MKRHILTLKLFGAISTAALLAACGGGGGYSSTSNGTLGVALTDAPACGFDAVNVTVDKVRVHQSATASATDAGWTDITLSPARKINLLNLTNGALENLGQTPLTPGHYTQLRLVLDANTGNGLANSVIPTGSTTEISLDTPSAVQSGIKLINQFDVAAGQRVDVVLDFDACKSVVKQGNSGNYALKPVVKVVPTVLNGINGFINTAQLGQHVMVSAEQDGSIKASTTPNATSGEFFLARLAPGNYDVVITADDSATAVVATVPVASTTSVTTLSTSGAPISLAAAATPDRSISGTVILTPASSVAAYVAAKQSFAAGPTVTVKYQGANLTTGAYTLSLPSVAPQLAAYSTTLPLAFVTKTDTTPGTGKYNMEATVGVITQVYSFNPVNISSGDQNNINFSF
ncbi:MAG: DUF4382 domain-containing protein [Burkholderiales bacterium]|nr:DUF4382 domain-containing protein [Burkholderiales bacterium]